MVPSSSIPPTCAIASMMSTPGMIGWPGKWPWKNGSLIVTFLIPTIRLVALDLEDPVHQQEGIPVGNHVEDPADVHRHASVALRGAGEPAGQRDVALVARPGRDHVGLDPAADQRQVAQDVAPPCGGRTRPASGASRRPPGRPRSSTSVESSAAPESQAPRPQRLDLVQEAERARRAPAPARTRRA